MKILSDIASLPNYFDDDFFYSFLFWFVFLMHIAEEREAYARANIEWGFMGSLSENPSFATDSSSTLRCESGRRLAVLSILKAHKHPVTALALSHNSRELFSGDSGGFAFKWGYEGIPSTDDMLRGWGLK